MFDNMQQLEAEVKEFQDNILASRNLINSLERLVSTIEQQQREYAQDSKKFIAEIKSYTDSVNGDTKELRKELSDEKANLRQSVQIATADIAKKMR